VSLAAEEQQKFMNLLALFQATSQEFAPEILPKINELFLAGKFAELNALIVASQPGVTKTQLDFVLGIYPDLAPALADAQNQANANPVEIPTKLVSPFAGASTSGSANTYFPAGVNPNDLPVQQDEINTGLDLNFNGIIGRAIGGPVGGGRTYMVNERGRELFTPNSNGFIMNAGDTQALLQGVSQLVSSGGGGMVNNFTVITPDAETAASATARKLRDAAWRN
jgi:hypothetical protein